MNSENQMTQANTTELPVNAYGTVDLTGGLPAGLAQITEPRCQPLCRMLGISYAPAFTGFAFDGYRYSPVLHGIVIDQRHESALRTAMAERQARQPNPKVRAARLQRRHDRETTVFAEGIRQQFPCMPENEVLKCAMQATKVGSGRVGRSRKATNPERAAVIAHIRHEHTDYDDRLDKARQQRDHDDDSRYGRHEARRMCRDEADINRRVVRDAVADQINMIVQQWQKPAKPSMDGTVPGPANVPAPVTCVSVAAEESTSYCNRAGRRRHVLKGA